MALKFVKYPGRGKGIFAISVFLTWKVSKMAAARVLVYGGRGALGGTCVSYFKSKDWVSRIYKYYNNS